MAPQRAWSLPESTTVPPATPPPDSPEANQNGSTRAASTHYVTPQADKTRTYSTPNTTRRAKTALGATDCLFSKAPAQEQAVPVTLALEREIQAGALGGGKPFLNPA